MSEIQFIAGLLHEQNLESFRLVDPERDLTPAWKMVYDWIINFHRDNGSMPKPLTVAGTFSVPMDKPPETAAYYAKLAHTNAKRAKLEEELSTGVVPHLEQHNPDAALEGAADAITRVRSAFPEPDDSRCYLPNMAVNAEERWLDYQFRSSNSHLMGLPLPWQSITRMTLGMQPGEAWALVARPNIGKSWAAIVIAVFLWQMGKRVLFCSMETPPRSGKPKSKRARERLGKWADVARQRLTVRFDAIAARVSAWRLLNGNLNPQELMQYQQYLAMCRAPEAAGWGALRIVSSPRVRTIGQLEQEANAFEPDLIIWDSAYIAIGRDGGRRQKRSDSAGFFLEDCKHTFERLGVPGLLTWHFNRECGENDIHASMNDIALTDDMPRLFDVIMFLFRPPEMVEAGEALWRSGKVRDGIGIPELRTRFEIKRTIAFDEISFGIPQEGQR